MKLEEEKIAHDNCVVQLREVRSSQASIHCQRRFDSNLHMPIMDAIPQNLLFSAVKCLISFESLDDFQRLIEMII